jgi:hypothetical protein
MNKKLTKSLFRQYLACPNEFWLAVNHPEFVESEIPPDVAFRIRQGYETERHFRNLIAAREDRGWRFQKKVESDTLFAKFDVFAEDSGEIYEVKSSKYKDPSDLKNRKDRDVNIYDIGFQVFAAREAGLAVSKAFLVTLNGDYILGDELDLERLFVIEDVSNDVESIQKDIAEKIDAAIAYLAEQPPVDFSNMCGSKLKCPYFKFAMPDFPERTVTEIPRLQGKKLTGLLENGIFDLFEVPDDYELTATQRDFVNFAKAGERKIDFGALKASLDELKYPLYFLDYETVNPSIPHIKGMSPLAQITFQYSLHVQKERDAELEHREFLSDGSGIPPFELAKKLSGEIGEEGSVIVWYKPFEMSRNTEMGMLYPEFNAFFESVNSRVFDLYEIFKNQIFRDPQMKNNSIKTVLPVLVPELSYKELEIGNGGVAMARWFEEVFKGEGEKKEAVMKSLLEYCKLDTLAMVKILEYLEGVKI